MRLRSALLATCDVAMGGYLQSSLGDAASLETVAVVLDVLLFFPIAPSAGITTLLPQCLQVPERPAAEAGARSSAPQAHRN